MSGECEKCGENALQCTCGSLCRRQQNDPHHIYSNMNKQIHPLSDGLDPPAEQIPVRWVNVRGRKEHEALIKDAAKCVGIMQEDKFSMRETKKFYFLKFTQCFDILGIRKAAVKQIAFSRHEYVPGIHGFLLFLSLSIYPSCMMPTY